MSTDESHIAPLTDALLRNDTQCLLNLLVRDDHGTGHTYDASSMGAALFDAFEQMCANEPSLPAVVHCSDLNKRGTGHNFPCVSVPDGKGGLKPVRTESPTLEFLPDRESLDAVLANLRKLVGELGSDLFLNAVTCAYVKKHVVRTPEYLRVYKAFCQALDMLESRFDTKPIKADERPDTTSIHARRFGVDVFVSSYRYHRSKHKRTANVLLLASPRGRMIARLDEMFPSTSFNIQFTLVDKDFQEAPEGKESAKSICKRRGWGFNKVQSDINAYLIKHHHKHNFDFIDFSHVPGYVNPDQLPLLKAMLLNTPHFGIFLDGDMVHRQIESSGSKAFYCYGSVLQVSRSKDNYKRVVGNMHGYIVDEYLFNSRNTVLSNSIIATLSDVADIGFSKVGKTRKKCASDLVYSVAYYTGPTLLSLPSEIKALSIQGVYRPSIGLSGRAVVDTSFELSRLPPGVRLAFTDKLNGRVFKAVMHSKIVRKKKLEHYVTLVDRYASNVQSFKVSFTRGSWEDCTALGEFVVKGDSCYFKILHCDYNNTKARSKKLLNLRHVLSRSDELLHCASVESILMQIQACQAPSGDSVSGWVPWDSAAVESIPDGVILHRLVGSAFTNGGAIRIKAVPSVTCFTAYRDGVLCGMFADETYLPLTGWSFPECVIEAVPYHGRLYYIGTTDKSMADYTWKDPTVSDISFIYALMQSSKIASRLSGKILKRLNELRAIWSDHLKSQYGEDIEFCPYDTNQLKLVSSILSYKQDFVSYDVMASILGTSFHEVKEACATLQDLGYVRCSQNACTIVDASNRFGPGLWDAIYTGPYRRNAEEDELFQLVINNLGVVGQELSDTDLKTIWD